MWSIYFIIKLRSWTHRSKDKRFVKQPLGIIRPDALAEFEVNQQNFLMHRICYVINTFIWYFWVTNIKVLTCFHRKIKSVLKLLFNWQKHDFSFNLISGEGSKQAHQFFADLIGGPEPFKVTKKRLFSVTPSSLAMLDG